MFCDAQKWVTKCEACQQFFGRPKLKALPLKPVVIEEPFQKWGLDFIRVLNPNSIAGHTHVLTVTDYFTKWLEAISVKQTSTAVICDFIKENILVRYGIPLKIMMDNTSSFSSTKIIGFCYGYGISLSCSLDYYPQGNGQDESSNKNIITIVHKLVE